MVKGLVSIIVPVYNVKNYLEKCINSILNQTYQNLEIIIVDDGSNDGSADICDRFLEKDKRVLVIHKENGGVVSARQLGIERAKGEYSIAIDSDDWIEPVMINELYTLAIKNKADMVTSGCYRESDNTYGVYTDNVKEGVYSGNNRAFIYQNMIFCNSTDTVGIQGWIWPKLIKTSLMREVHSKINYKICYAEDLVFVYTCCLYARTIVVTHNAYYHYIMRTGSAIFSVIPNYFKCVNDIYLFLKNEFKSSQFKDVLIYQLDLLMVKWAFMGLDYYMGLNKNISIPYYDFDKSRIKQNAKIILYSAGRVGQAFYQQICVDKLYDIVGWVDKKFLHYQEQGLNVTSVETIQELDYDYILLAFKQESLAKSVKRSLISEYGILEEKIIWIEPVTIIDKYVFSENKKRKL